MCFGKSDDSSSRAMVQMQKDEAAEARNKEIKRQARIDTGLSNIKAMFHGGQTKNATSGNFTFSGPGAGAKQGGQVTGLPPGFTYVHTAGSSGTAGSPAIAAQQARYNAKMSSGGGNPNSMNYQGGTTNEQNYGYNAGGGNAGRATSYGGGSAAVAATPAVAEKWQIRGPDGKLYNVGASVDYIGNDVTGNYAGPDEFLKKYEQNYLGNFLPQVATQFKGARDDTTYQLADAGTLQSSMAGDELAKLIEQNKINEADVRNKATSAVGDLKGRLASEEAKAQAQLFSTEDPETSAANALHAVQNITAEEAPNTMLGDIFKVAAIGGANYLKGGANKAYRDQYVPGAQPASHIVNV